MMFPSNPKNPTREQVDIELAAHGASIVLVRREDVAGGGPTNPTSTYNRRITATTPMKLTDQQPVVAC